MTIADLVHLRARSAGDRIAYTLLADGASDARSVTWRELDLRARQMATALAQNGATGKPVLLTLPSGLAFIETLLACWYAGAIAVPVSLPRHVRTRHRLERIAVHCGAELAVASPDMQQRLAGSMPHLRWLDPDAASSGAIDTPLARIEHVAVLQYTSGSTGEPRGVVVGHDNLLANSEQIARACGHDDTTVIGGWLPLFHDMGLVGLIIQAAFSGSRCVFMSPERFLMRPRAWLAMITRYGICSSPAPNFAYDLCAEKVTDLDGIDLSGWRNALNGSEPVRAATLDRFASAFAPCGFDRQAFYPCYGLAEATLMVTSPRTDRRGLRRQGDGAPLPENSPQGHVGCGQCADGTTLAIVDAVSRLRVPDGQTGEIWVRGPGVARGYHADAPATASTFRGVLARDNADDASQGWWLRTGDLGFVADGSLFITGRLREMIVLAGRNVFPTDIERTVEAVDPSIGAAAAVSAELDGTERLVVAAELRRRTRTDVAADIDALVKQIAMALAREHEVAAHAIVILGSGQLPRTTSGKVSRLAFRDAYLAESLPATQAAVGADG